MQQTSADVHTMLTVMLALVLVIPGAVAGRGLLQTFPSCGAGSQSVTLDATQLAFRNLTKNPPTLAFACNALYEGYSRGCVSNSVYTYIIETIGSPPYLAAGAAARPYISAYAKPADTALEVKQELYHLDLLTGSIYVSPPASQLPPNTSYPQYTEWSVGYDSSGYPDNNEDLSGKCGCDQAQYAFFLNEIRSAVQNVTSTSGLGDDAFACNPAVSKLQPLLQYLYQVQGTTEMNPFRTSPPLVTGPLPAGKIPQWG